jgi:hypothetical protein
MPSQLIQTVTGLLVAACLCLSIGCNDNSGKTKLFGASVSGKVIYKDQPLGGGTIRFVSLTDDNQSNTARINADGTFTLSNAPVGECRVLVETESARVDVSAFLKNLPPDAKVDRSKIPAPMKYVPLDTRYNDPKDSPLRLTIKPGNQTVEVVIPE